MERSAELFRKVQMKKLDTGKTGVKLGIYVAVAVIAVVLGLVFHIFENVGQVFTDIHFDAKALLKIIIMTVLVLIIENVILLILSLIKTEKGKTQSILSIVSSAVKYITALVIICWALSILGANVGTIVAGVGIVALIVGFAANSVIADLVTGIFMIFENQYNVGDYIEVGGFRGRVTSIGIRTTCLEDAGGNVKIINNSDMSNILNRSDHTSKAVATIGIPYETDLEKLEEKIPDMMKGIFERHQDIMLAEPIYLGVDALADSSVHLKFVVEVDDKNIFSAGRQLNRELFLCFRNAGVEVPFPQVDVHQK